MDCHLIIVFSLMLLSVKSTEVNCVNKNSPTSGCCSGNVTISSTVINIANDAFQGCSIDELVIPDSVVSIGSKAFDSNYALSKVTFSLAGDDFNFFKFNSAVASEKFDFS